MTTAGGPDEPGIQTLEPQELPGDQEEFDEDLAPGQAVLEVDGLTVDFRTDDGIVHAVRGVSYSVIPGETLAIVGESGSGKSVSCMALMGLLPKTATIKGSARFRGVELLGLRQRRLNRVRGKRIAMIFQDPMTSMNPVHRVGAQIAEAIRVHEPEVSKRNSWNRAVEMLELVDIPNPKERARSYPHEFSGGMRQRAVIAMAMANNADVLIADEPTTALDVTVQAQVLETLEKVKAEFNSSIILITHDLGVVAGLADRVMVMYAGKPVEFGTVTDIYDQPRMPYTLGLLGSLPRVDAGESGRLVPIKGVPPSLVNLPPGCPFEARCPIARELCVEVEPALLGTADSSHLAACHYSSELEPGVDARELFELDSVDDVDFEAELGES